MKPQPARFAYCLLPCLLASSTALADPGLARPAVPRSLPAPAERAAPALPLRPEVGLPSPALDPFRPQGYVAEARELVRRFPRQLEIDRAGGLRVLGEILALDPDPRALEAAVAAGFRIGETRMAEPLGLRLVVLRPGRRMATRSALVRLQTLDPTGVYTFNHIYLGSAAATGRDATDSPVAMPRHAVQDLRVGLVDGGVDASHPAMVGTRVRAWGCDGRRQPSAHGTAVASLLAGGTGPGSSGAELYAADIYCGEPTGGSVLQLVQALAWLASHQVGVVNLSLVGPDNPLLARAVRQMNSSGHVLVSAVGNDGPRSPPLYPAAYAEVIGVTAVDEQDRLLPEAVRGPHARFAAPGARLMAAGPGGSWQRVRGTSFASALVARLAAETLPAPNDVAMETTIARFRSLSRPGKTPGLAILPTRPLNDPGQEPDKIGRTRE